MVDISIVDGGYKVTYNWGRYHIVCFTTQGGAVEFTNSSRGRVAGPNGPNGRCPQWPRPRLLPSCPMKNGRVLIAKTRRKWRLKNRFSNRDSDGYF